MSGTRCAPRALLLGCLLLPACATMQGGAATAPVTPAESLIPAPARAAPGDTVYLVEHYIRPERQQHFEDFVAQVLWPAFTRLSAADSPRHHALRGVRLLRPTAPDDEGVLVYTFVLDPYVGGESYNVLDLLREVYPEERARREYDRFTETWARDFTARAFVQSAEPAR